MTTLDSLTAALTEEREAFREALLVMNRERAIAVLRAEASEAREARANENFWRESAEVVRLVGVIARAQSSEHRWPAAPTNTVARIMLGHRGLDVAICTGDTVDTIAKMIAGAMAQHERMNR